jgi:alginate O-acetyltransferase complex protein AlgI
MLFNSLEFILIFLPLTAVVCYLIRRRVGISAAITALVVLSLCFYGWWKPAYLGLIATSLLFNFSLGNWISITDRGKLKKAITFFGVAVNLALIGVFKYYDFFVETSNSLTGSSFPAQNIVLPLAISFFTFQQIGFLVDVYKGKIKTIQFGKYCLFITFFPQLIAGPIVHYREIVPQLSGPRALLGSVESIASGMLLFSLGLAKKTLIADHFGLYADATFNAASNTSFVEAWFGSLAFAIQIYFDFSAYSDMALGLALLFGISLPINFNSPYKALNIVDFWRRWHITLSKFLRDYLYIPLGGGRRGRLRSYRNVMIVMLLGGLWHGPAWTFVAWGGVHGGAILLTRMWWLLRDAFGFDAVIQPGLLRIAFMRTAMLLFVSFAWVPFRANTMDDALMFWRAMILPGKIELPVAYMSRLGDLAETIASFGIIGVHRPFALVGLEQLALTFGVIGVVFFMPNSLDIAKAATRITFAKNGVITDSQANLRQILHATFSAIILAVSIMWLTGGSDDFLYFQF